MYNPSMYYPSPTMQNAQQRLQNLEAQYPQFAANPTMGYNPPQQGILKGRPVSNLEEANAAMIDFDGSLYVFPDKAHGKIYTKQLGLDGNIIFLSYSLDTKPENKTPASMDTVSNNFATREELSKAIEGVKSYLAEQLDQLTSPGGN